MSLSHKKLLSAQSATLLIMFRNSSPGNCSEKIFCRIKVAIMINDKNKLSIVDSMCSIARRQEIVKKNLKRPTLPALQNMCKPIQ